MKDPIKDFEEERLKRIEAQGANLIVKESSSKLMLDSINTGYSYNFSWMGRPVIQYPQDIVAMQEIIWEVQPDLIIETGIAHGGSLIMYASFLELIGHGEVVGIDIDIRAHNKKEIESHPMSKRITMIEGSSIDQKIVDKVKAHAQGQSKVMVVLDSNHTHEHVKRELDLYADFVSKDSYMVVFDTVVEDLPNEVYTNRAWGKGDNPKTAVWEFLKENEQFEIDKSIQKKLLITVAPDGYLKRVT
jgi:cephalosporin hydroxylase